MLTFTERCGRGAVGLVSRNVADVADATSKTARPKRRFGRWCLAAPPGIRRGELLGLRWSDVDLDAKSICIRQNLVLVDHQTRLLPAEVSRWPTHDHHRSGHNRRSALAPRQAGGRSIGPGGVD